MTAMKGWTSAGDILTLSFGIWSVAIGYVPCDVNNNRSRLSEHGCCSFDIWRSSRDAVSSIGVSISGRIFHQNP